MAIKDEPANRNPYRRRTDTPTPEDELYQETAAPPPPPKQTQVQSPAKGGLSWVGISALALAVLGGLYWYANRAPAPEPKPEPTATPEVPAPRNYDDMRIYQLADSVSHLTRRVESLETERNALKDKLASVRESNQSLAVDVRAIGTKLAAIAGQVEQPRERTEINQLRSDLNTLAGSVENIQSDTDTAKLHRCKLIKKIGKKLIYDCEWEYLPEVATAR